MRRQCEAGGTVQLRCRKLPSKLATHNVGLSYQSSWQEMRHDHQESSESSEQYSDTGFPTLPRPKTILSLSRASLPWSICNQATKLGGTLPLRVKKGRRSEFERQLHSICVDAAVSPVRKASGESPRHPQLAKQKSLSAISDRLQSVGRPGTLVSTDRSNSISVSGGVKPAGIMSHHMGRKGQASAAGEEASQQKSKKSKKPSKALSFSFGANSERKRRALGFLGKGEKKAFDKPSPVAPNSPILHGKKSKTLPVLTAESKNVVHPLKSNGLTQTVYSSYQDIRMVKTPILGAKQRPPPLQGISNSLGLQLYHSHGVDARSPQADYSPQANYSPASTHTSGSLPISANSEASLRASASDSSLGQTVESPNIRSLSNMSPCYTQHSTLDQQTSTASEPVMKGRGRKLSDPVSSATDSPESQHHPRCAIKKRNTFCVRPSRISQSVEEEWKEMRQHVVKFLVQTEQSYVESLEVILKVYYEPLNRPQGAVFVEPALVGDIFYQIPEICSLHQCFLQQLVERVEHWDSEKKIGDILVNTFSRCQLLDIYRKFIGNFMRAKASIELAKQSKSMFSKFLDQRTRHHEGKLTLDDLLIKPVQRIPRYVLFIKDLLKHTAPTHPDHAPLQQALGELTMLAESVNDSERERERVNRHKELICSVDGLSQLLSPSSHFMSYNMITEVKGNVHKRDRFLILFSDLLVCVSSRRKSTSFKRSSLLNLNSVSSESLKYNIKWHAPLTLTSVAQIQTPSVDRRKQNTLEKIMENLQKDDAILQEMLDMSDRIHQPHQALVSTLKELQVDVRQSIMSKKAEFDDLPLQCNRIDLISYASALPTQYIVLFPSHGIKTTWEQEFLRAKRAADNQAPSSTSVAPPMSPLPVQALPNQDLTFLNSVTLQSVRVGMQITCAAAGLAVDSSTSSCLWVCSNDGIGGQVSLLNLHPSATPQLAANISLSDSCITCITAVPVPPVTTPITTPLSGYSHLPDISINSTSSSSSSDHVTLSPASSFASDIKSMHGDREDDVLFIDGELEMSSSINNTSLSNSLTVREFSRVRSNSAPPTDPTLEDETGLELGRPARVPSPATGQQTLSAQSSATDSSDCSQKMPVWSALTLRPSTLERNTMWLGTEAGELHVFRVGDNLRYRNNRITVQLGSAVLCVRHLNGAVYAGLANGTLAVLDAGDPSSPCHTIAVGGGAVFNCLDVMGGLWVSCQNVLHQVDLQRHTVKPVCTLPSHHQIAAAHVVGNSVWVTVQNSSLLHLVHVPSGALLTTIDCMQPVSLALKSCDPVHHRHKTSSLHLTSLHSSPTHLFVGTSAGMVLAITLPFIEPSLEPHPLSCPPASIPLYHGHADAVRLSMVLHTEGGALVITGGSGHRDFTRDASPDKHVPDTTNCLLLWR